MGGGALVDGVRRWFQRRSHRSSAAAASFLLTHDPAYDESCQEEEEEEEEEEDQLRVVEDLDLSCLPRIRVPKRFKMPPTEQPHKKVPSRSKKIYYSYRSMPDTEFFTEYGEASQYQIQEVIGKGSYGVVAAAVDTHTGERVAIKKINDVFEHVSDATRILREIKLLRLLRHPDVVEIKHIMLPPSRREFKDIYVVFELMESDLHQVIKANDDLTPEHYQFFLYQLLRALKYIHTGFAYLSVVYAQIRNEKARRYLSSMRKKTPVPLSHKFPSADPLALRLLERLLAFDPKDRPTAEEVRSSTSSSSFNY
ncbi:hypothetical protein GW17_00022010 [Ensete ventricosum]|nr:hypothetical protein GW17_00022010 [Ensete ventricosum]